MAERITIKERAVLEPSELTKDYISAIHQNLIKRFKEKYIQKYGFIIKIHKNIEVLSTEISPVGAGIFFTVKFDIDRLKLREGQKYTGTIFMVDACGYFVNIIEGKNILVLIPEDRAGKKKLKKDDKVELQIENLKGTYWYGKLIRKL